VAQLAGAGCAARREHLLRPDSAPEYISRLNARYGGQPASVLLDDGSLVAGNWLWVETDSILLSSESGAGPLGFSPERVRGLRVRDRAAGARAGLRAGALAGSLLGLPLGWALSGYNLSGRRDDPTVWERAGGALVGATILGALFGVPAMLAGGAAGGEVWIHPRGYGTAAADSAAGRERLDRWPGFPGGR